MLVLARFHYRQSLESALPHVEEHRAYLRERHAVGELVISGPFEPRTGGCLLLCVADMDRARQLVADDPFVRRELTEYALQEWRPVIGTDLVQAWETRQAT